MPQITTHQIQQKKTTLTQITKNEQKPSTNTTIVDIQNIPNHL